MIINWRGILFSPLPVTSFSRSFVVLLCNYTKRYLIATFFTLGGATGLTLVKRTAACYQVKSTSSMAILRVKPLLMPLLHLDYGKLALTNINILLKTRNFKHSKIEYFSSLPLADWLPHCWCSKLQDSLFYDWPFHHWRRWSFFVKNRHFGLEGLADLLSSFKHCAHWTL